MSHIITQDVPTIDMKVQPPDRRTINAVEEARSPWAVLGGTEGKVSRRRGPAARKNQKIIANPTQPG
jgi:hypothetical protein